jgi:hypothetical protein
LPHFDMTTPAMKIVAAIFGLALLTIAFGAYSDHIMTHDHIATTAETPGLAAAAALQHK